MNAAKRLFLAAAAFSFAAANLCTPRVRYDPVVRTGTGAWAYNIAAQNGPDFWKNVNCKNYWKCGDKTQRQSPINIVTANASNGDQRRAPFFKTRNVQLKYKATPNNFEFDCEGSKDGHCGEVTYDGTIKPLVQVRVHQPSEHHLNGVQFDLEAHFVYTLGARSHTEGFKTAVVAVFVSKGAHNKHFQKLLDAAHERSSVRIDLTSFLRPVTQNEKFFAFKGSFTTPPCSFGILWLVSQNVITVSPGQMQQFSKMMGGKANVRPLQPSLNRKIEFFAT